MVEPKTKKENNKSRTSKTKNTSFNINTVINDSEWECIVAMAVERDVSNSDFITFFQEEAKKNIRPVIKELTLETLIQSMKKEQGNAGKNVPVSGQGPAKKSGKPAEKPQTQGDEDIVEAVLSGLKKGEVPNEPLAKLIRKYILNLKQFDIDQRKTLESAKKDSKNVGKDEKIKSPKEKKKETEQKDKGKPGKKSLQPPQEVLDHPPLGPNLYLVLSGFYDPNLLTEMVRIGIPIRCLIVVDSEHSEAEGVVQPSDEQPKSAAKKDLKADKIINFWNEVGRVLSETLARDLATIRVTPSNSFKNCEQKKDKLSAAYNEMSYVMYKIYDYWRKYKMYINSMTAVTVEEEQIMPLENAYLYNALIHLVPLECCTVEVVLHCMLEQVSWWAEHKQEENHSKETIHDADLQRKTLKDSFKKTSLANSDGPVLRNSERKNRSMGTARLIKTDDSIQQHLSRKKTDDRSIEVARSVAKNQGSMFTHNYGMNSVLENSERKTTYNRSIESARSINVDDLIQQYLESKKTCDRSIETASSVTQDQGSMYTTNSTPSLISSYDFAKKKTFHLNIPALKMEEIMSQMFQKSAISELWNRYRPRSEYARKLYNYHLQNFKDCCDGSYFNSDYIFNIYLHQILLERMMFVHCGLAQENYIGSEKAYFGSGICDVLHDCGVIMDELQRKRGNTVSESVSAGIVGTNDEENLVSSGFLTLTEKRSLREKSMTHLKTFLECTELRNLFDDIEDLGLSRYSPVKDEIKRLEFVKEMDAALLGQTLRVCYEWFNCVSYDYFPPTDCIVLWFHQNRYLNDVNNEKCTFELDTLIGFRDFYGYVLFGKTSLLEDIERKNKKREDIRKMASAKNDSKSYNSFESLDGLDCKFEPDPKLNRTFCYDLGLNFVKFKETVTNFYSEKGVHVRLNKRKSPEEPLLTGVKIDCENNTLSFYQNVHTESKLKLHFKTYNDIIISADTKLMFGVVDEKEPNVPQSDVRNTDVNRISREESVPNETDFGLRIALPNGLLIEVIRTDSTIGPFYVRQKYLDKHPSHGDIVHEKYRCYLKNGSVLVFKEDETVDVLYSNSTIVKCTNFRYVVPTVEVEKVDEIVPDVEKNVPKKGKKTDPKNKKEDVAKKGKASKKKKESKKEEIIEIVLPPPPVLKMDSYIISALGECLRCENDVLQIADEPFTLRLAYDPSHSQLYTLRSEGTRCLHYEDSLVVEFPQGTRVVTSCEKDINIQVPEKRQDASKVSCVKQYIKHIYNSVYGSFRCNSGSVDLESSREELSLIDDMLEGYTEPGQEITDIKTNVNVCENKEEETFDVLTMDCVFEDKNFASVNYKNSSEQIVIQLPGSVSVALQRDGVEVVVESTISLSIDQHEAILAKTPPASSTLDCLTIVTLARPERTPEIVCETIDSEGRVFLIDSEGDAKMFVVFIDSLSLDWSQSGQPVDSFTDRCFVMRRDHSGYEMIHKNHPSVVKLIPDISATKTPVLRNADFLKYYKQTPVMQTRSEEYLMKEKMISPVQLERKDLSTPAVYRELWFPNGVEESNFHFAERKIFHVMYKAYIIESFHQIKRNADVSECFNEALREYVERCTKKCREYEKHVVQETRTEKEVVRNAKFVLNTVANFGDDESASGCSVCEGLMQSLSSVDFKNKKTIGPEKVLTITDLGEHSSCESSGTV